MSAGDGWLQGMDVSKWQPTTPDLTGVHYLIARCGIGTKLDATYDMHIANARKAGILTGSYWFGWGALSVSDQVNAYIANEGDVSIHVLDWESADGFTAAQAKQFISLYKSRSGNRIFLYASEGRFTDLGQDLNWIANYSTEPSKAFDIWQYGSFHGADGNYFRGTLAELKTLIGVDIVALPITDETEKIITVGAGTWYALDGKTPVATGTAALGPRPSPYEAAPFRAMFATVGAVRQTVLVKPATVADVPPVIKTVTVDATQAQIDAAKAAQKTADAAALLAATDAAYVKGKNDEKARLKGFLSL